MVNDGPGWLKARSSIGSGACVELSDNGSGVSLRNSRHPGTEIRFTGPEMVAFIEAVKLGEFDELVGPYAEG